MKSHFIPDPNPPLDPVCLFHGKRRSEHDCLYCTLCFRDLTPEECWEDESGQKWDICVECKEAEDLAAEMFGESVD